MKVYELIASIGTINFLAFPFLHLPLNLKKLTQERKHQHLNGGLETSRGFMGSLKTRRITKAPSIESVIALNTAHSLLFWFKSHFPPQHLTFL